MSPPTDLQSPEGGAADRDKIPDLYSNVSIGYKEKRAITARELVSKFHNLHFILLNT
jgi:hypothetical protein